jgi:hypothetical protein
MQKNELDFFTKHGRRRLSQRGLKEDAIDFVLRYGECVHASRVDVYFLGKRHIPRDFVDDDQFSKLQGTTVVVGSTGGRVLTAYKNKKNGLKRFRHQREYWVKMW